VEARTPALVKAGPVTATDWIIDIVLIGLVVLQLIERRLSIVQVLLPVAIIIWAIVTYVHSIPTDGNNLFLITLAVVVGAAIGAGVGLLTRVRVKDGVVVVKATIIAAILWVMGMGSRLAFQLWATHGGGMSVGRFDFTYHLSTDVWASALIFMAAATIALRSAILLTRVFLTGRREGADASLLPGGVQA